MTPHSGWDGAPEVGEVDVFEVEEIHALRELRLLRGVPRHLRRHVVSGHLVIAGSTAGGAGYMHRARRRLKIDRHGYCVTLREQTSGQIVRLPYA